MSELILHHYAMSPFAEKIRLILGYKKLAWQSVTIPSIMPKPDLVALTGGYRRTPVLQIGADIYCDTALICDVLEQRQPTPSLHPQQSKGARIVAQWADSALFQAAMAYNFSAKGAAHVFQGQAPEVAKAFAEDRARMRGGASRMHSGDAASAYRSYLRRIAAMVDEQAYVLGEQPSLADFCCYHPLWFTRRQVAPLAAILDTAASIVPWMDRMEAYGHGAMALSDSSAAIAIAAQATPAAIDQSVFQDDHGIALGSRVSITAESFGLESTEGELLAATRTRYSLRRSDPRAGTVHVHFPRVGFQLRAV